MKPVEGRATIVEEADHVARAAPPYAYLGIAEAFMPGVVILSSAQAAGARANAFLCAHILECLLKACLSRARVSKKQLTGKELRHNLLGLWSLAISKGVTIPADAPRWVVQLSHLHNEPKYYLRYPADVNGIVMPETQLMVSDLTELVATVRAYLADG
jgi:hypothetical protein